jgi:transglutaminase-like putative cysteine protease
MIALCRLCKLPARYVSGYLVGEGPMHAWVEVLLPSKRPGEGIAWPFDPTHDRTVSLRYLTVAVGRDYADVSPTRGTFRAATGGTLSSHQFVGLTAVQARLI